MIQQPISKPRKRRGKCALIDPEQVRHLISEGMTRADVAELYDVSTNAIDGICQDYGITVVRIGRGPKSAKSALEPRLSAPAQPAPVPTSRRDTLIATGGRYADLREWAARWGVTEVKARQEWHLLRLPVRKGVSDAQ